LQVQAHFIHGEDLPIMVVLQKVGHFFSSCASNSASTAALG
jgi:hypothetical protein